MLWLTRLVWRVFVLALTYILDVFIPSTPLAGLLGRTLPRFEQTTLDQGGSSAVIIFTRFPQPGCTKTRLAKQIGAEAAAQLQQHMTEHIVGQARKLQTERNCPTIIVCYHFGQATPLSPEGEEDVMKEWLGCDLVYLRQVGSGDLGQRMRQAFKHTFELGKEHVLLVGADIPGISTLILATGLALLQSLPRQDIVLGPAVDGGYYCIGLNKDITCLSRLFTGIHWSTSTVLEETLHIARGNALNPALLEPLSDVDTPEDLRVWDVAKESEICSLDANERICVIIPTLNEESNIVPAVKNVFSMASYRASAVRIVVADGGSSDETKKRIKKLRAQYPGQITVITSKRRGRSYQLNAGAEAAIDMHEASILLFLHADTWVPPNFDVLIRSTLRRQNVIAGAFSFSLREDDEIVPLTLQDLFLKHTQPETNSRLHLLERGTNWRARRLFLPWGDQAYFLRVEHFLALGKFSELALFEDVEFVARVKQAFGFSWLSQHFDSPLYVHSSYIRTSAR